MTYTRKNKGVFSEEHKKKIGVANRNENNGMWKGDKVGYFALHTYVKGRLEKPELCQKCNEKKAIDLANKGVYDRNLENWWWLCRSCHMISDGRMNNLNRGGREKTGIVKKCLICGKEKYVKKCLAERGLGNFCSYKCTRQYYANHLHH